MSTTLKAVMIEKPATQERTLASVLYGRNIGIIPAEQVEEFKRKAQARARMRFLFSMRSGGPVIIVMFLVTFFLAMGSIYHEQIWLMVGDAFLASMAGLVSVNGVIEILRSTSRIEWFSSFYRFPHIVDHNHVPRDLHPTIAMIAHELPGSEFYVEKLVDDPDPFLKVTHGNQSYYIGHWGEPEFQER